MMAVLVTGGAGYIGSHTVVALHESGRRVVVVDDFSNSSPAAVDALQRLVGGSLVFAPVDVTDPDAVDRLFVDHDIDAVIHFAAFKAVAESTEQPLRYYRNNLDATVTVTEAMVAHGVRRMVFSSSATVYGEPERVPVDETFPTGATNPYGWTKFVGEQILRDASAAHGLDVVLLRYFNPVGAHPSGEIGEDPAGIPNNLVPYVMQVAVGRLDHLRVFGGDYDTHDGTAIRDYIHVVDLAEGHVAALDALDAGLTGCEVVNLGTGVGSTVLEVVEAAGRAVGHAIPYEIVDRRPGDVERIWADVRRAESVLGWRATRGLDEMLADHWRWQRTHPQGYATPAPVA
ncbi:MAG: UDP-glucose 4-epimerase GalE [Actinomyces sp.]|nr:MAG: UDP-glucose 4-epimerase GalE [Actinomyces sp.]